MKLRARKKGCERLNGRNRFDLNSLCFHSFVLSPDFFHCFLFSVSIPDQRVESKKKDEQVMDQMRNNRLKRERERYQEVERRMR